MFRAIREQIDTVFRGDPAAKSAVEIFFCYPGFHAILLHRLAHKLHQSGFVLLARIVSQLNRAATGIEIHPGAKIGRRLGAPSRGRDSWLIGLGSAAEQLKVLSDNLEFGAFLAGLFVVPGVQLEVALNEGGITLLEVLLGYFRRASPERNVHEGCFLFLLAFVVCPCAIYCESKVSNGGSLGCVTNVGIPSKIAD